MLPVVLEGEPKPPRPKRRLLRLLRLFVVLVLLGGAGVMGAWMRLDPVGLREKAVAAVWHQTGRVLKVGAVQVHLLPYPSVSVRDLALSDMPGGARPEMLTATELDARLALLPLLRHEIRLEDVRLTHPDLLMERMADGRANWQMQPPAESDSPPGGVSFPSTPWRVRICSVRVRDADLRWDDRRAHASGAVTLDSLDLSGLTGANPTIEMQGHRQGDSSAIVSVSGQVGQLFAAERSAWPVRLQASLRIEGRDAGSATLDGTLSDPMRLRGYDVAVHLAIGRLADLNRLFVHAGLPDVHDIDLTARVVDLGSDTAPMPGLRQVRLRTGAIGSVPVVRGLVLDRLAVDAPTPADHVAIETAGHYAGQPFALHGTLGTPAETLAAARSVLGSAMPLDLVVDVAGGSLRLGGTVGGGQSALDGHLTAGRLSLPGNLVLDHLTADAHLAVRGGADIRLTDLRLDSAQMTLDGDLSFLRQGGTNGVPLLNGRLHASRLDVDTVRAAAPAAEPSGDGGAPSAVREGAADDAPLPFERLRQMDGDLDLTADRMRLYDEDYHAAEAHFVLRGGHLTIDPLHADGVGRSLDAVLSVDASGAVPRLSADVRTLVLPADWLAQAFDLTPMLRGSLQLVGSVQTQGNDRAALRDNLGGHLGLSMVRGQIDGNTLGRLLGPDASAATRGTSVALRCLGVHMTLGDGRAALDTIGLQTFRLAMTGHGTIGLAQQDLDLHLMPQLLIGGSGASMPIVVAGTIRAPQPRPEAAGPGHRFMLTIGPSAAMGDPCPDALKAAREEQPGPAPDAAPKAKAPKVMNILRGLGLFR
ncbi:AsmA family protein [Gluconacetobacter sp. 1b LMG 1731]|uniref:AsmA family protein n=1 Tax=Gluconacetobacter dulcium TaxID=2729096 RepID=A0A7W4IIC0_9PROT|nr:AsmA family protein [Gluconacetobacter dulcium]MBB2163433.1 AsmA family protein [Gluconacetobacter dulcium]MBB2192450.1 AsmA family protein [Gluconacetobacter dulcium]